MTSGPFLVEGLIKQLWPGYEACANRYTTPETRRRASTWLALFGVFVAGFLAFNEEHEKLRQAQAQAQAQAQQARQQSGRAQAELQQMRDQLAAMRNMLAGRTSHQIQVMQQLSRFDGEAMALLSARVTTDELPAWKERQEKLESDAATWIGQNIGTEARERLLDMGGFVTDLYPYVEDTDQRDRMIRLEKIARNILALMQDEAANAPSPHGSPY